MTTNAATTWTLLLCLIAAASASAASEEPAAAEAATLIGPPPTIAFYEVPGCPICAKINSWLDALDAEHPKAAVLVRQPVTKEGIAAEMEARGIEHHGVAILNGAGELVWVEQAHVLTQEALSAQFLVHVVEDRTIRSAEAGCGRCIYKIEGAKGCPAAVKIDGKAMLLSGVQVDAHGIGLCSGALPARVAGHVEGDEFVATFFEVD